VKFWLVFFLAVLFFSAGCKKKPTPITSTAIRGITRELASAARDASGGRAEVDTRAEYAPRHAVGPPALAADHVYITVPRGKSAAPDRALHDSIVAGLDRVAHLHHLQHVARTGGPGLERFDYVLNGRRTQSIHLITPFTAPGAAVAGAGGARLAIVIDDLGYDRAQADALFRLAYPLTLSVLPHEANSSEVAEEAHRRGYEVMLHLPVASNAGSSDEAIELHPGMSPADVENTFGAMLDTVPYAVGVNNHEGSLGTADQQLMGELMPLLRQRHLFFIDSRTTAATVAETTARAAGVATARRNVFLDDEQTASAVRKQFELAIHDAMQKGSALAIGHPHLETLEVLNDMLPEAERQGVRLVFASDLAR
jgi:polysaccharide deacetylase 2 family uncharacterized protein YibQ